MRDTLYIQLRDSGPETPVAHARVNGTPGASVPVQYAPLDAILADAAGTRLVLFVPGADVRLATVTVPARQAQKILQAAPYALEDQLAEDVDTLHFAIAPVRSSRAAGEPHPVAVVARQRMDQWLAPFRARQLVPDAMVPDTLSLPPPGHGHWTALAEPDRLVVRTAPFAGFACALSDLDSYLPLADPEGTAALRLFITRGVDYDFTRLPRPVELLPGSANALEVLVRHWQPEQSINLLQGEYEHKQDWRGFGKPWRIAAGLAAAWLAVSVVLAITQAVRESRELARQQQANVARYQELNPGATRFENLDAQVRQELAALRGGGAQAPLLKLLDTLAASLGANPGLALQSMQLREGALYLSLTGSDLQGLEGLRAWYASRSDVLLAVTDTNASPDGVQVRVKLTPA